MGFFDDQIGQVSRATSESDRQAKIKGRIKDLHRQITPNSTGRRLSNKQGEVSHAKKRELIAEGQKFLSPEVTAEGRERDLEFVLFCAQNLISLERYAPELDSCNAIAEVFAAAFGGLAPEHLCYEIGTRIVYLEVDGKPIKSEEQVTLFDRFMELGETLKAACSGTPPPTVATYLAEDSADEGDGVVRGNFRRTA